MELSIDWLESRLSGSSISLRATFFFFVVAMHWERRERWGTKKKHNKEKKKYWRRLWHVDCVHSPRNESEASIRWTIIIIIIAAEPSYIARINNFKRINTIIARAHTFRCLFFVFRFPSFSGCWVVGCTCTKINEHELSLAVPVSICVWCVQLSIYKLSFDRISNVFRRQCRLSKQSGRGEEVERTHEIHFIFFRVYLSSFCLPSAVCRSALMVAALAQLTAFQMFDFVSSIQARRYWNKRNWKKNNVKL